MVESVRVPSTDKIDLLKNYSNPIETCQKKKKEKKKEKKKKKTDTKIKTKQNTKQNKTKNPFMNHTKINQSMKVGQSGFLYPID